MKSNSGFMKLGPTKGLKSSTSCSAIRVAERMTKRDFEQKLAKEAKGRSLRFEIPTNGSFLLAIPNYPRLTDPAFAGSVSPYRHSMSSYSEKHLAETVEIAQQIDSAILEKMADLLVDVRERSGRLFFLGVGGSAANASHAVNDFRKIAGFECYAPTDNVSELTARTNDAGCASVFVEWLRGSRLRKEDAVVVFSVGGGNLEKNVSPNLVSALQYAKEVGAAVLGVVGRDGGYTAVVADVCCVIPTVNAANVTPHSEAFQGVVWHLLVSHPKLKIQQTKWESTVQTG